MTNLIIPIVIFGVILYSVSIGLFITLFKWLSAAAIKIILMVGAAGFIIAAGGAVAMAIWCIVDWISG